MLKIGIVIIGIIIVAFVSFRFGFVASETAQTHCQFKFVKLASKMLNKGNDDLRDRLNSLSNGNNFSCEIAVNALME